MSPGRESGMGETLRIGQLAKLTGLTVKAIRYYEARGLLPPAPRTTSGYRLYSEADVHRLEFIRNAKALGLPLRQIRKLAVTAREQACAMARPTLLGVLEEQIDRTARQIQRLTRLKRELERRRQVLASRPPTDHGRGYCCCLEDGQPGAPLPLKLELRTSARSEGRERRSRS